ncbi:hypothetical protein PIIN_11447 [Serendipita indica DSM 11827]|uniref:Uncharacterized protein n=1 Tax=Serendipita indica (strain DSM 11827) TaxID=1109443 RepID=G4U1M7_SERID|nr:hypothetical protein PIIN_11447 [Serendipita indica DSM 11827]
MPSSLVRLQSSSDNEGQPSSATIRRQQPSDEVVRFREFLPVTHVATAPVTLITHFIPHSLPFSS